MTALPHKFFTGEFPRLNAYDLQAGAAQSATNCDFTQGNLQGLKNRVAVPGISAPNAKSIFIYDSLTYSYYTWNRDVDAVRGPITDDAYNRFYWSDGSNFWVSRGDLGGSGGEPSTNNKYWVGVPQPSAALTAADADQVFSVQGLTPRIYSAFCEGTDGSRKNEVVLTQTVLSQSFTNIELQASAALSCDALNASTTTTTTTTDEWGNETTSSSTINPSVTYTVAVEVRFYAADNINYLGCIFRLNNSKNTYNQGLSGIVGRMTYIDGVVRVGVSSTSNYRESRAYTYTYVNQYGEEGPPADPTSVDILEGQKVTLTYTAPPSNSNYCPITRLRVYRTSTGGSSTEYLFLSEIVIDATHKFTDDIKSSALGESIQTRDFFPPPQNLKGIVAMPGGVLAGFSGTAVYFSEPYLPYAWRPVNSQALQNRVIGLCPYENGLYVTTTAHPVLITGYNPGTMSSQKIPAIQAGVSKGSIVNAGPFAVYASHDGLVTLRGIDASLNLSFKFFTRAQWRNLYGNKLDKMHLNAHDGHLLAWFDDGTPGFLIRMDETSPSFTKVTDPVSCALVHPESDALYVGYGSTLYNFKSGGSTQTWTHWGKDYILPSPQNFGCIQFVGSGTINLTVYADGTSVHQQSIALTDSGRTIIRLPSGFLARRWSFKVDGLADSYVYEMNVASSLTELASV